MKIIDNIQKKIAKNKEVLFNIKVIAGAKKNSLKEDTQKILQVRVVAPAVDNKANKAVIKFLAVQLGLRRYQVEIVKGETSPQKTIKISR